MSAKKKTDMEWSDILSVSELAKNVVEQMERTYTGAHIQDRAHKIAGDIGEGENWSTTGKSREAHDALLRAGDLSDTRSAGRDLEQIKHMLGSLGLELQRTVRQSAGLIQDVYRLIPKGQPDFFSENGRGTKAGIKPKDWVIPIDKNGRILYDSLERGNLFYPTADTNGNVKMLSAIEVGLRRAAQQLQYASNQAVIRAGTSAGASVHDMQEMYRRLDFVLNKQMRSAISPGSAMSQYSPSVISELQKTLKLEGTDKRAEVVESAAFLDHMFDAILNKYTSGGSIEEQNDQRSRYMQQISKMSLLIRSKGLEKGLREIQHSNAYSDILNSPMAPAIINAISNFAKMSPVMGPVSDANGLRMTYMQGLDRALQFFLPPSSRKGYQTELGYQEFAKATRDFAHTRGALIATRTQGDAQSLSSKVYDTTRLVSVTQEQLSRALRLQSQDPANKGKPSVAKNALLSVLGDAMVLDRDAARERIGIETISKSLSDELIQQMYNEALTEWQTKSGTKEAPTAARQRALMKRAIINAMSKQHGDVFDSKTDDVTFGSAGDGFHTFGIRKLAKLEAHDPRRMQMVKWVTPGSEIRATAQYTDMESLLPYLAQVFAEDYEGGISAEGVKKWTEKLSGVKGLIQTKEYAAKNLITPTSGLIHDIFGTYAKKYAQEHPEAGAGETHKAFAKSVMAQFADKDGKVPEDVEKIFNAVFSYDEAKKSFVQTLDPELQAQFKKYAPAFLQAMGRLEGDDRGLLKVRKGKGGTLEDITPTELFNLIANPQDRDGNAISLGYQIAGGHPIAVSLLQHMSAQYGAAGAKGGHPVTYGYREFGSIRDQLGLSEVNGRNVSAVKRYYELLSQQTQLPKNVYSGLLAYQDLADRRNWGLAQGTALERLAAADSDTLMLDIKDLIKDRRQLLDLNDDLRDSKAGGDTGLFKVGELATSSFIGAIQAAQRAKYDEILARDAEKAATLVEQAGGDEAVKRLIKTWEDAGVKPEGEAETLEAMARRNLGASMIPYSVSATFGDEAQTPILFSALDSQGNGGVARYLFGPHIGANESINSLGQRVIDLGTSATGLESFLRSLSAYANGETFVGEAGKASSVLGQKFLNLQLAERAQLTQHGGSSFDKANSVDIAHAAMPLNISTYENLPEYEGRLNNAIVLSPGDIRRMLQPIGEEQDNGVAAWNEWLATAYLDVLGDTGETTIQQVIEQAQNELTSSLKKRHKKQLTGENLDRAVQGTLIDKIISSISLTPDGDFGRGLVGLLNRFPSLNGRNDLMGVRVFANPAWGNEVGKIGGDPGLMPFINGDFDGDHLAISLPGFDHRVKMDLASRGNVLKQFRESMVAENDRARAIDTYLRKQFKVAQGPSQSEIKPGAFDTNGEQDTTDIYTTKTGKGKVGPFSYIRQAFTDLFRDAGVSTSHSTGINDFTARIAAEAFENLLAIPEQKAVSAKKMGENASGDEWEYGWSDSLDKVYNALRDRNTYNSDARFRQVLDLMENEGWLATAPGADSDKQDLGVFDSDDMAMRRLGLPILETIVSMATAPKGRSNADKQKLENLQTAVDNLFGAGRVDINTIRGLRFSGEGTTLALDTKKSSKESLEALKGIKFDKDFYLRTRGWLDTAAGRGFFDGTSAGVNIRAIGDIVANRHSIIPGLRLNKDGFVYNKDSKAFTDEQKQWLAANQLTLNAEGNAFKYNELARAALAGLTQADEEESYRDTKFAKIGKNFFSTAAQVKWLQSKDALTKTKAVPIAPGGYGTSATRLSKVLFPFGSNGLTTDYLAFYQNLKDKGVSNERVLDYTTPEALSQMFRSFQSIEGGNLAHVIAQTYLDAARQGVYTIQGGDSEDKSAVGVDAFIAQMVKGGHDSASELGFDVRLRSKNNPEGTMGIRAALQEYEAMAGMLGQHEKRRTPISAIKATGATLAQTFARALGIEASGPDDEVQKAAQKAQLGPNESVLYIGAQNGNGSVQPVYARADTIGWHVAERLTPGAAQQLLNSELQAIDLGIMPQDAVFGSARLDQLQKWADDAIALGQSDRLDEIKEFRASLGERVATEGRIETLIGDFKTAGHVGPLSVPNVVQDLVLVNAVRAYQELIRDSGLADKYYEELGKFTNKKGKMSVAGANKARAALLDPESPIRKALEEAVSALTSEGILSNSKFSGLAALYNAYHEGGAGKTMPELFRSIVAGSHAKLGGVGSIFMKGASDRPDEGVSPILINEAAQNNPFVQSAMGKMILSTFGESDEELTQGELNALEMLGKIESPDGRNFSAIRSDPNANKFVQAYSQRVKYHKRLGRLQTRYEQAKAEGSFAEANSLNDRIQKMQQNPYLDLDAQERIRAQLDEAIASGDEAKTKLYQGQLTQLQEDAMAAYDLELVSAWAGIKKESGSRELIGATLGFDPSKYTEGNIAGFIDELAETEAVQSTLANRTNLNKWKQAQKDLSGLVSARAGLMARGKALKEKGEQGSDEYSYIQSQLKDLGVVGENGEEESSDSIIGSLRKYSKYLEGLFREEPRDENGKIITDENGKILFKDNAMLARAKLQAQFEQKEARLSEYRGLQQQRVSMLAEKGLTEARLADADAHLSTDERAALEARLIELDNQLNNHVLARIAAIQELFNATDKEGNLVSPDAKKEMDKITERAVASEEASRSHREGLLKIANLQGQLDTEQGAFKTYSDLNNAEYRLWENEQKLGKAPVGSPTARLLEMERHDLEVMRDIAKERVAMMEADTEAEKDAKHKDYLRGVNISAKERADLMLQQRQESYLNGQPRNQGLVGSIEGKVGGMLKYMVSGYGIFRIFNRLMQSIKKLTAEAKELDKVMVNLRIVTGDTKTNTRNLMNEYSELAAQLGSTTKEVAASAIGWLRQGYSTAEAMNLVKSSMYLSTLGMMDSAAATKSLTSALKGFKLQASESMDVVDKLTALDLKAATSAGDIAEGLAQFANLGSLAGVNIDQAAAYVATIADVTQMSGSSAGQALKTIISRYGNVKAGAYNRLSLDSDVTDDEKAVNDVEKVLKNLGISIRNSNLSFRDFDDVLGEIAEKWDTLDTVSQKAVATSFAGIRQQEAFVTLMQNWDKYEELLAASQNSEGTAERKYVSYREGAEAAQKELAATIEKIVNTGEISELITGVTKVLTDIAKWLPELVKYFPQVFFNMQQWRALSGNSLLQQAWRGIKHSRVGSTFADNWAMAKGKGAKAHWSAVGQGFVSSIFGEADPEFAKSVHIGKYARGNETKPRGWLDRVWWKRGQAQSDVSKTVAGGGANANGGATTTEATATPEGEAAAPATESNPAAGVTGEMETWLELVKQITVEFETMLQKTREITANKEQEEVKSEEVLVTKTEESAVEEGILGLDKLRSLQSELQLSDENMKSFLSSKEVTDDQLSAMLSSKELTDAQLMAMLSGKELTDEQLGQILSSSRLQNEQLREVSSKNILLTDQQREMIEQHIATTAERRKIAESVPSGGGTTVSVGGGGGKTAAAGGGYGGAIASGVLMGLSTALSMVGSAVSAYQTGGLSHVDSSHKGKNGEDLTVQSSEAAKQAGGSISALYASIPFIGSILNATIGKKQAEKVMQEIDAERDQANWATERAESILSTLNSISSETRTIANSITSIAAEDSKERADAVQKLLDTLYDSENKDTLSGIERYLGGKTVYAVLKKVLSSDVYERREASREFEIAQSRLKTETLKQSYAKSDYDQMHTVAGEAWINYNKTRGAGYNSEYGITDEAYRAAKEKGFSEVRAAEITGAAMGAIGTVVASTVPNAIAKAAGTAVAIIGTAELVIANIIGNELGKAYAKEAQHKESVRWSELSSREQRAELETARNTVLEELSEAADANTKAVRDNNARLAAINKMLGALDQYDEYVQRKMEAINTSKAETALLEAKTENGTYLTDLTTAQAESLGKKELYELYAKQIEADGGLLGISTYINGELSVRFKEYAKAALESDEELKAAMSGKNYTVAGALRSLSPDDWGDLEILENFANVFGVTVGTLMSSADEYINKFGTLTYAELIKDTGDLLEEQENYHSLLSDITDSTKSATEWMDKITTKFPELIGYMSDTPALIGKIMDKLRDLTEYEFQTQWETLAGSSVIFDSHNPEDRTLKKDILNYIEQKYETIQSGSGAARRAEIDELIKASKSTDLSSLIKYLNGLDSDSQDYIDLYEAIAQAGGQYELTSDAYKESLSNYIDYNSKLLGNQIDNLTNQRDMLQQITKQREYENRLIEAKLKLEDAIEQKQRVYRAGVGFVYESDQGAIKEAQENLHEVQIEKDVSAITKQIETLQGEKDEWDNIWEKRNFELQEEEALAFADRFLGLNDVLGSSFNSLTTQEMLDAGLLDSSITTANGQAAAKVSGSLTTMLGKGSVMAQGLLAAEQATKGFHTDFTAFTAAFLKEQAEKKASVVGDVEQAWNDFVNVQKSGATPGSKQYNDALRNYQEKFSTAHNSGYITSTSDGLDNTTQPGGQHADWSAARSSDLYGSKRSWEAAFEKIQDDPAAMEKENNPYAGETLLVHTMKDMPQEMRKSGYVLSMKIPRQEGRMSNSTLTDIFTDANVYRLTNMAEGNYALGKISYEVKNAWGGDPANIPNGIYIDGAAKEFFMMWNGHYYNLGRLNGDFVSGGVGVDAQMSEVNNVVDWWRSIWYNPEDSGWTANLKRTGATAALGVLAGPVGVVLGANSSLAGAIGGAIYGGDDYTDVPIPDYLAYLLRDKGGPTGPGEWYQMPTEAPTLSSSTSSSTIAKDAYEYWKNSASRLGYARGSLGLSSDVSPALINELGTEAIITPSGTVTALPSGTGIVPADITKNLWALGEIAPSVLRAMDSISLGANSALAANSIGNVDESVNISSLTMSVNADSSFDADAFVESIRQRVALTRNLRK